MRQMPYSLAHSFSSCSFFVCLLLQLLLLPTPPLQLHTKIEKKNNTRKCIATIPTTSCWLVGWLVCFLCLYVVFHSHFQPYYEYIRSACVCFFIFSQKQLPPHYKLQQSYFNVCRSMCACAHVECSALVLDECVHFTYL